MAIIDLTLPSNTFLSTILFFSYLSTDMEKARSWKKLMINLQENYPQYERAIASATSVAQLESKIWIIDELKLLDIKPNIVGILGGWYSNFLTPLLLTNLGVSFVWNFEIDQDVKTISYKFNRKYKADGRYQCHNTDIMFKEIWRKEDKEEPFDTIINTSCEHMYPMRKFRKLNNRFAGDPLYVLQSTDDDQYDDHINCVSGPEELAKQADFTEVLYSGTKLLDSGMNRFMVIGK
jgi:hypothetical protein